MECGKRKTKKKKMKYIEFDHRNTVAAIQEKM